MELGAIHLLSYFSRSSQNKQKRPETNSAITFPFVFLEAETTTKTLKTNITENNKYQQMLLKIKNFCRSENKYKNLLRKWKQV